jgi:hypothetical protein
MKHVAPNVIDFSNYRTPSLAPKMSSREITPSQGIEGDPIYAAIERHGNPGGLVGGCIHSGAVSA